VAAAIALLALAFVLYREYRRDLNEAERRLTFVSQVSHELKTPLTNIRLYAELLEENLADEAEDERRYVGVLVGESRRLSRLIDNVLAFSRQRQERLRLHPAPGCIDDTIREVLEQFAPALGEAGIVVETSLDAAGTFRFDRDAVAQILGNLIGNVEKYAASGGWMRVSSETGDGVVRVRVEDRGPGIPPAHRGRIFRPFHRVDDSLTARSTGTGIGLSIARALARLHGGDLQLTDSSAGASFEFHLPLGGR
jgi:signal transduction histidine kinase